VTSPSDVGLHLVSFHEKPGEYQPCGHFDASRTRELELMLKLDVMAEQSELVLQA